MNGAPDVSVVFMYGPPANKIYHFGMARKPAKRVDASRFQGELEALAHTIVERLKDEWPTNLAHLPFAQGFFVLTLRYVRYVFRVVCRMFADERRADSRWRWEEIIVLPAINRTVLDSLFNTAFMLEDIEARSAWYHKSGWREQKLEFDRWISEYGSDPDWKDWLPGLQSLIERGVVQFSITESELDDPKKQIQPWPSTGQMSDYGVNPAERPANREFLHYMTDLYYRDHSAQSHMSFLGIMKLGAILSADDLSKDERGQLEADSLPRLMTSHLSRTAFLLLCLISELQNHFKWTGTNELRILNLWHILIPDFPEAKDIFEKRYSSMFPALLIGKT
jgi:hypothetical protein